MLQILTMTTRSDRPGWTERICYTAGGAGIQFAAGTITGFYLIYLTNVALLDIAACSVIIGVSRFFDGISDIMVGNVIDRTDTRLGKARVWILRMSLPFAVALMLLFWIPTGMPVLLKYVYAFVMYNVANTLIVTFMQISHYSMVSLISEDRKEQTILSSLRALAKTSGGMLGAIVFIRFLNVFTDEPGNQNTQLAYTRSIAVVCIIMLVLTLLIVIGTKERVHKAPASKNKILIRESAASMLLMIKDRYWDTLLVCNLMINLVMQMMATGAAYYALYVLGDMNYASLILLTSVIPSVLMMIIVPPLSEKFGKRKVFSSGLVIAIIGLLGFGISAPTITPMLAFYVLYGFGNGMLKGASVALTADMVIYTEETKGQFIAGAGNAGLSATDKLGTGIGSVLFGTLLAAAGFDAALETQTAAATGMVSMLFIWIPMLMLAVVLVIFTLFFDLERNKDNEIRHSSAE